MHKVLVASVISRIFLVVCFFMVLPLGWAIHDDIHSHETMAFSITIALGLFLAGYFRYKFKVEKDDYKRLNPRDGLAIVGLSWVVLSIFGALPLYLSQVAGSYTDALFETVSGFTTTGATIFADVESLPRGILFWRSLTQWLGGMGIIVFYIALLPAIGQSTYQLYKAEAPGISVERTEPRIRETAKNLWIIYVGLSLLLFLLLVSGDMPLFHSLCHTFTTMASGGFSTKNASIGAFSPYIQWVIMVFMFLAGVNFMLHYLAIRGRPLGYFKREEFRYYFLIVIISIVLFSLILAQTQLTMSPVRDAAFQVITVLTSTGYMTTDFDLWPNSLRFALVIMMLIGGCGGSTSGGMKMIRFVLTVKVAIRSITQSIFPNAILPIKFNKVAIPEKTVMAILSYFAIYILLLLFGAILFNLIESTDLVTSVTAALSTLSNIGPGLGDIGPSQNFGWISLPGKWLLIFLMLAGRLELFAILILFLPATWRK